MTNSTTTFRRRAEEACYNCGSALTEGYQMLKSDQMTDYPHGVWITQKYCEGDGTLNCASLPTEVRRGPLFDEWVTWDIEKINDACDSDTA